MEEKLKSLENKTTLNIVNASYLFTQFSTLAKIYTITAREPSIYPRFRHLGIALYLFPFHEILHTKRKKNWETLI